VEYTAAGQIDVVTDIGLEPYDFLPLAPLIEAAGGVNDRLGRARAVPRIGRVA